MWVPRHSLSRFSRATSTSLVLYPGFQHTRRKSTLVHARLNLNFESPGVLNTIPSRLRSRGDCDVIYDQPSLSSYFEDQLATDNVIRKMKSTASVLTTPTVDTAGTSVVLTFDDKKYMFGNAHEGLQRVCIQNGERLVKLNNIFLTGKTEWRTTGGLLGLILTAADVVQGAVEASKQAVHQAQERWEKRLQEAKTQKDKDRLLSGQQPKDKLGEIEKPRMNIFGGENIMQLIATARRFIFRKGLPLDIHELGDLMSSSQPTWEDHNIQVWAMPLRPRNEVMDHDTESQRKRPFDTYLETAPAMANDFNNALDMRKQQLKGVISDMFDSDWRLDALFETPLVEVQQPAVMFVRNPETRKLEQYLGPLPGTGADVTGINVLVRKPWPGALVVDLPDTQPSSVAMSYIVKNQPRRGRFDPILARKFGVKPGPAFRELSEGKSVKNDKGETIMPEQVIGESKTGRGFAVIEIPSVDYIPSLQETFAFNDRDIMQPIEAIFWIAGPGVTRDQTFQALIKKHPDLKHIISSPDHCANYLSIDSAAAGQLKHRQIDKERFSIPLHNNLPNALPSDLSNAIIAQRGLKIILDPDISFSADMVPGPLNTLEVIETMSKKVKELGKEAQKAIKSTEFQEQYQSQSLPSEDAEIITLGTGSAAPSKQRNVSSTLIRVPNVGSYLLDAGENTIGQLSRIYSREELKEVLQDLKLIWISHMHADHHLGLTSVIKAWHTAVYGDAKSTRQPSERLLDQISNPAKYLINQQKLCIASEPEMLRWLREYSEIEDFGYEKIIPLCVNAAIIDENDEIKVPTNLEWHKQPVGFQVSNPSVYEAIRKATGLSNFDAVNVVHCTGARAVSMTWPSGLKISYSGDCRPSGHFAVIGRDSTVLIHEATFDDALGGDAKAKKHSTTGEAIGVGIKMRAKRIILTHFSQRYSKLPEMENVVARPIAFEDKGPHIAGKHLGNHQMIEPIAGLDEEAQTMNNSDNSVTETLPPSHTPLEMPDLVEQTRKHPAAAELEAAKDVKIGVAFDLMRVKVKDIIALNKFNDAFQKLYVEPEGPDPAKTARQAEAEAVRQKKAEEKQAKQEKRRLEDIARSTHLKRMASQSSNLSTGGSLRADI